MRPPQSADVAQAPKPQTPAATAAVVQQQEQLKKQKAAEKKAKKQAAATAAAAPPPPAPAPTPAPSTPPPVTPSPVTPPADTNDDTTPPAPNVKLTKWEDDPAGAYTVVVYKFPDKAGAKLKAQEVAQEKLPAGVFHSDDYESLEPGSWIVFIGEFDTADEASRAEAKYDRAGYPGEVTYVGHQESPGTDNQAAPAGNGETTPQS
jgi:hypothetical protein